MQAVLHEILFVSHVKSLSSVSQCASGRVRGGGVKCESKSLVKLFTTFVTRALSHHHREVHARFILGSYKRTSST